MCQQVKRRGGPRFVAPFEVDRYMPRKTTSVLLSVNVPHATEWACSRSIRYVGRGAAVDLRFGGTTGCEDRSGWRLPSTAARGMCDEVEAERRGGWVIDCALACG